MTTQKLVDYAKNYIAPFNHKFAEDIEDVDGKLCVLSLSLYCYGYANAKQAEQLGKALNVLPCLQKFRIGIPSDLYIDYDMFALIKWATTELRFTPRALKRNDITAFNTVIKGYLLEHSIITDQTSPLAQQFASLLIATPLIKYMDFINTPRLASYTLKNLVVATAFVSALSFDQSDDVLDLESFVVFSEKVLGIKIDYHAYEIKEYVCLTYEHCLSELGMPYATYKNLRTLEQLKHTPEMQELLKWVQGNDNFLHEIKGLETIPALQPTSMFKTADTNYEERKLTDERNRNI